MARHKDITLKIERFPQGEDADYRVTSKKEIQFILQDIAEKGTRVVVYYNSAQNFIMTTLLAATEKGVWLDVGPFPPENKLVLLSDKLTFVSLHQHIKVQFEAHDVEKALYDDAEAFYIALPEYLLRIQRREYFRLSIPASTPVKCTIPVKPYNPDEPDEPAVIRQIPVLDISGGGVCLHCGEDEADLLPGKAFQDCEISLPGIGTLSSTLKVKNNIKLATHNDLVNLRVGCEFYRLNNQMDSLLQRYITQLQSGNLMKGMDNS